MVLEKISQITTGQVCIKCKSTKLYKLKDNRLQCSNCKSRFSIQQLSLDLWSLYYFNITTLENKISLTYWWKLFIIISC